MQWDPKLPLLENLAFYKKKQKKPPQKIEIKHKFSLKILINIFG
jgi:hypothetical protein